MILNWTSSRCVLLGNHNAHVYLEHHKTTPCAHSYVIGEQIFLYPLKVIFLRTEY